MLWVILAKIVSATVKTCRSSFRRPVDQAQLLAHGGGRGPDLLDRPLQIVLADAEMPGPVMYFVGLSHRNMASIARALVEKIVTHCLKILKNAKGLALGGRRGLGPARPRVAAGRMVRLAAVSDARTAQAAG